VRGYSREEVDAFMRDLAQHQRTLTEELAKAKQESEKTYLALGEEIGALLQHAKDIADDMVKKADEEAARLRDEARRAAERTQKDARDRSVGIIRAAEKDAGESIAEAEQKIDELQGAEMEARERLQSLRALTNSLGTQIEEVEKKQPISRRPAEITPADIAEADEESHDETAPGPKADPATVTPTS
jgi:cell division septum initiation protein DivIVA